MTTGERITQLSLLNEINQKRTVVKSVKEYQVEPCKIQNIRSFVEKWHYSGNVNGVNSTYCFRLMDSETMIGAMIYGSTAMANVWRKYANHESELIELRRLCCVDDTPKNTESFFIGKTLKWLKKNTDVKTIISYADETYGHKGIVYMATNFKNVGMTNPGKVIIYHGKRYHDKTIRTKYKGELKPYAKKIKDALQTGEAHYESSLGKHIYIYELRKDKGAHQRLPPRKGHHNKPRRWHCNRQGGHHDQT